MDEEQVQALVAALNAAIDARLMELGVITEDGYKAPIVGEPPAAPAGKKAARGKGKPAPAPEHTRDELKDSLLALVKAQDKQAAVDALARFGCKKLTDVRDDQVDEFFDYLEKAVAGDTDPAAAELFG